MSPIAVIAPRFKSSFGFTDQPRQRGGWHRHQEGPGCPHCLHSAQLEDPDGQEVHGHEGPTAEAGQEKPPG